MDKKYEAVTEPHTSTETVVRAMERAGASGVLARMNSRIVFSTDDDTVVAAVRKIRGVRAVLPVESEDPKGGSYRGLATRESHCE